MGVFVAIGVNVFVGGTGVEVNVFVGNGVGVDDGVKVAV